MKAPFQGHQDPSLQEERWEVPMLCKRFDQAAPSWDGKSANRLATIQIIGGENPMKTSIDSTEGRWTM